MVEVPTSICPAITVEVGPVINPANGHAYYRLSSTRQTGPATEEYAVLQLHGHLVTINDAAENAFVYGTFSYPSGSGQHLWLGYTDRSG